MNFGENLKLARENKGLTQQQLADELYVTRQAVSKWERGSRYPDLLTTKCIANILDVTVDSLVSNDEMMDATSKQNIAQSIRERIIISSMYAIIASLSLSMLLPKIVDIYYSISDAENVMALDAGTMIYILFPVAMYLSVGIIAICGFVKTVRQDVTPKIAGVIGSVFYSLIAAEQIVIQHNMKVNYQSIIYTLFVIAYIVLIVMNFIFNKRVTKSFVVCSVVSFLLFAFEPIYELISLMSNGYLEQYISYAYVVSGILKMFIALLLMVQIAVLKNNRQNISKIKK